MLTQGLESKIIIKMNHHLISNRLDDTKCVTVATHHIKNKKIIIIKRQEKRKSK